jgi:hypothetical protein
MKKSEKTHQGLYNVGFIGGGMRMAKVNPRQAAIDYETKPYKGQENRAGRYRAPRAEIAR